MTRTNRPAGRTTRRGANLTASLVATGVVVVALLMVLQGYYHCSEALKRTQNRSRALMVLESQAETIRAAGFGALPPVGQHAMPAEALQGLPGASGSLILRFCCRRLRRGGPLLGTGWRLRWWGRLRAA